MRFVHAADLHLDSPLRGLARYEGAPVEEIRAATRRAFAKLIDDCIDRSADFLLLAGDLFDGDWRDYSTGLFFCAEMSRLREAGIRVFMVRGNHDAASRITRHLHLPENVTDLATHAPETVCDERLGIAVHGQGFAHRVVDTDLAERYPAPVAGMFNIGLLHTSLDGRPGHASYAPTRDSVLAERGYDYWALGHVHAHEVVGREPWIVYPGCLQGRHARETGPKGAVVVEVDGGRVADVSFQAYDVVRWAHVAVDISGETTADAVLDRVRDALGAEVDAADGRMVAARVRVEGASPVHGTLMSERERWTEEVRAAANDVLSGDVWVEDVRLATRPVVDIDALAVRGDVVGQLAEALVSLRSDREAQSEVLEALADLMRKLPREAREGASGVQLDDDEFVRSLLADVEGMLLPLVFGELGPLEGETADGSEERT